MSAATFLPQHIVDTLPLDLQRESKRYENRLTYSDGRKTPLQHKYEKYCLSMLHKRWEEKEKMFMNQ